MREPHVTFGYHEHQLCGGRSHTRVTQGPHPQSRQALINTEPKANEGQYVTRDTGRMGVLEFMRNAKWAQDQKSTQVVEESVEEWLKRHKIV